MADYRPIKANFTSGDVTSLGEVPDGDSLPVALGGTGATTAEGARTALGAASLNGDPAQPFSMSSLNGGPLGGRRNLLFNGDARIDQRANGVVTTVNNDYNSVDRIRIGKVGTYTATHQRVEDAPTGFKFSSKVTVTASAALGTNDYLMPLHFTEGQDLQHLLYGSSAAKPLVLSFWVKATVAGTYGVALWSSTTLRSNTAQYTIASANTWEHKTVVFVGDQTYTIPNNNVRGICVVFDLGIGSNLRVANTGGWTGGSVSSFGLIGGVSLVGTAGASHQVTGLQLEVGTIATPFDYSSYGAELAACQRYYREFMVSLRFNAAAANQVHSLSAQWPTMRISPTIGALISSENTFNLSSTPTLVSTTVDGTRFQIISAAAGDTFALAYRYPLSAEL